MVGKKEESSLIVEPQVIETSALSEITRAEIDIQITTAKRYPRSVAKFRQEAMSMATTDTETAASCFYTLKRGKGEDAKVIEGPSVRLAEICAVAWGNMRYGARIVEEGEKKVKAQGVAFDLEKNVGSTIEVSRRITTREGARFSDDMIIVTENAACSIALRNAIYKTIPFTYVKQIYLQCKKVAAGTSATLKKRRDDMFAKFAELGVKQEQILAYAEKASAEDIGLTELEILIGTYTALKDGDSSAEQLFGSGKTLKPTTGAPQAKSKFSNSGQHEIIRGLFKKVYKDKGEDKLSTCLGQDYGVEKIEELTLVQADNLIAEMNQKAKDVR